MSKNLILCRTVLTILTLLWMLLIFMMSGANDDESNAQSGSICRFLCETFVEGFEDLPPEQQQAIEESLSFPVRKCAHFSEYTILGVLLMFTSAAWFLPQPKGIADVGILTTPFKVCFALPFFTGVLYAASDEFHQLFVPGRAGQIRDVLIDSCGVFVGICIANGLRRLKTRRQTGARQGQQ